MRPSDFLEDHETVDFDIPAKRVFRADLAAALRRGSIPEATDVDAAVALVRLVHDELEAYGTDGAWTLTEDDMREALRALRAVINRIEIRDFEVPFRDYGSFYSYWIRNGAKGSYQARRDLLEEIFGPLHDKLADLEVKMAASSLAEAVSPRGRTGWTRVDEEIAELRRHFHGARSPQDYRNIGNDCVTVIETLSRQVYDASLHLREGEPEPPVTNTKQRLDRFIEDAIPGSENRELRRLARATIDRLYEANGFVVEGTLRAEFFLDGAYVNDVLMARHVLPDPH